MKVLKYACTSICLLFSLLSFGCMSAQTDKYVELDSDSQQTAFYEERFTELDAMYYMNGRVDMTVAQVYINDMENAINGDSLKKADCARLYALQGLIGLLKGDTSFARDRMNLSRAAFKGDVRASVLEDRLNSKKGSSKKHNENALFIIEDALNSYSEKDYAASVAYFDEAFLLLDSFYQDNYRALRDFCWSMRSTAKVNGDSNYDKLLTKNKITVENMLELAATRGDLMYAYTAGKAVSSSVLYKRVAQAGDLTSCQSAYKNQGPLSKDATVTKTVCARFLWNLWNKKKNTQDQLNKYSAMFVDASMQSPVPDVSRDSADFDAVLGVVENDLMHLEDGINFAGDKTVSAVEFIELLQKFN